jgi:hypothetical protein
MPKANAIGTPIPTQAATITTKNTIRLPNPMAWSIGWPIQSSAAMPPTVSSANPKLRHVVVSSRRSSAIAAASPLPTSSATTRYPSEICSEISSTKRC